MCLQNTPVLYCSRDSTSYSSPFLICSTFVESVFACMHNRSRRQLNRMWGGGTDLEVKLKAGSFCILQSALMDQNSLCHSSIVVRRSGACILESF